MSHGPEDARAERADRMARALDVLVFGFVPGAGSAAVQELELANALLGAAEAHVLGCEIDMLADPDIADRTETVADQALRAALPEQVSQLMVQQFRAERLQRSLTRAAGGTDATVLISYWHATERLDEQLPEGFLQLALAALRSCTERLRGLAE